MKQNKIRIAVLIVFAVAISSCTRDEVIVVPPAPTVQDGVYVLCEGGFVPGTSKLAFYDFSNDTFYPDIYAPGTLGLFPDGIVLTGNYLYITEQGNFGSPGKIYKLDTNGTAIIASNLGVNPFNVIETNGRLYVTNGPSDIVSVVSRDNLQLLSTVNVRNYPQELTGIGNRVFVCNAGSFSTGPDSVVSVIDAGNNQVIGEIRVGKNPSTVTASTDGKLLVGCPGDSLTAAIYKVDPISLAILDTFTNLPYGLSKDLNTDAAGKLYFIGGNIYSDEDIVSYSPSTGVSEKVVPKQAGYLNYGLSYDKQSNQLYVGAAASDFTSDGRFRIYSATGNLIKDFQIPTGIAPRRLLVKR